MSGRVQSSLLDSLSEYLSKHMGLFFTPERRLDLLRGIREASDAFGFNEPTVFINWIMSAPLNRHQIEVLARFLTVGETYFMREKRVLEALEKHILPNLISRCRRENRPLKIWSAGCCTGEEPYTLAMMIDRLAPGFNGLNVQIHGSDINPLFIKKAEEGIYTDWSFRGTPASIKSRYFTCNGKGEYLLDAKIRKVVNFSFINLAQDVFPGSLGNEQSIDVILCRNVLMYFKPRRLREIIKKFHHSLDDDGWLIVGPSESSHLNFNEYNAVEFPGTILYKKSGYNIPKAATCKLRIKRKALYSPVSSSKRKSVKSVMTGVTASIPPIVKKDVLAKAHVFYNKADYPGTVNTIETYLNNNASSDSTLMLLAGRAYANMGKSDIALKWVKKAILCDKLNPKCYHLQAVLLQEQNRLSEAVASLKRVLYLDHNYMMAHFMLGNLCVQEGRHRESQKHFENTMTLLKARDRESVLPETDGITAGGLLDYINYVKQEDFKA